MTVTYSKEIATATFQAATKLLFRWKGSVVKLVWLELLVFLAAFFFISIIYRFALNEAQQRTFNKLAIYCERNNNLIPIAFALGFFVTFVVGRWWEQFKNIPWPDRTAMCIATCLHGRDEDGRLMRRSIVRYLNLATILVLSSICIPIKKRFPSLQHMADAGLIQPNEQLIYESTPCSFNKFFIPLIWAGNILSHARKNHRIKDDITYRMIMDELLTYRSQLGMLLNYDWICVPLVYTQVVTISVYAFFLFCLFGRQFTAHSDDLDPIIPVFTILQFVFYMGWFKVAETLLNPFGEDDDDFDANQLMDRHLQVAFLIVDGMYNNFPSLTKDQYWNDIDFKMPYTLETENLRDTKPFKGSVVDLTIDARKALFAPLPLRSPIPENHSGTSLVGSEMALRSTAPRLTWPYLQTSSLLTSPRPIRRLKTRHYDPDDADDTSFPAEIVSQNPPKFDSRSVRRTGSDTRLLDDIHDESNAIDQTALRLKQAAEEIVGVMDLDEQEDNRGQSPNDDYRRYSDIQKRIILPLSSVPESHEELTDNTGAASPSSLGAIGHNGADDNTLTSTGFSPIARTRNKTTLDRRGSDGQN